MQKLKSAFRPANAKGELRQALVKGKGLFWSLGIFSVFVNLLMLTGPLFMLQVYDRVLASRSMATLTALFLLVAALYAIMGVLDYARGRVAARIGADFQNTLDARVFDAILRRSVIPSERAKPATGLRDLESVQRFMSAPVVFAIFDIPWTPIFILAIFIFHPLMGWLAIVGGLILITVTILNQMLTKKPQLDAQMASNRSEAFAEGLREQGELVQGLGMRNAVLHRWKENRDAALGSQIQASDQTGIFTTLSKTFRFFLQSAMLALGAYLVLKGQLSPGAMIAGSILMGRALAPVDQAIGGWSLFQRARQGWSSLEELLNSTAPEPEHTPLPAARSILEAQQVTVVPPGEKVATLRMLSFRLEPGQALGVIGPSGSGKSTLARVLTGIWPAASGKVRLDGATLDQYSPEALGAQIGYLPQDVALFNATVTENIARLAAEPDPAKVVEAAKKAGAHEMILNLSNGYDTVLMSGGGRLSGGQKQRIGLARAMYGDPAILILDEPNSNLDSEGGNALNQAIRTMKEAGKSVIIMAHRPSGITECDLLLVIENGMLKAFGPRDEVLREQIKNYNQIAGSIGAEGKK
ncbi:type I secretion system permease/ATPase [Algicella marina]|uniref:Type I secretion system permease/ATPase n=1 Tax=Algicella marina TaxID=2683284 RepID=A0A6P1T452_9RHOB|nr:type I secretion system permease/ATPase [Algicella marina]QHQ36473.1 type I secretion system permease/ATPase [Algicella marina]